MTEIRWKLENMVRAYWQLIEAVDTDMIYSLGNSSIQVSLVTFSSVHEYVVETVHVIFLFSCIGVNSLM
jgi:hypothetical protein